MAGLGLLFLVLLVVFVVIAAVTVKLVIGIVLLLVVAGLIGWLADSIVPGELPFGWVGAIAAGLIGSWIGGFLLGPVLRAVPILNLSIFGVHIIPAIVGAIVVALVASVVFRQAAPSDEAGR